MKNNIILRVIRRSLLIGLAVVLTASPGISETKDGNRDLLLAIRKGDLNEVNRLLKIGAEVNADNGSALMSAATCGHANVAKLILDRGAEINARSRNGWTALMAAASNGHTDVLKLLLERGADVNATDRWGRTAIEEAAERGHWEQVKALDERGAKFTLARAARLGYLGGVERLLKREVDVNAQEGGRTALMWAAMHGHDDETKLLLESGADFDARGKDGRTAMKIAQEGGHDEIVRLLKRYGAEDWWTGILKGNVVGSSPKSLSIRVSDEQPANEISVTVGLKTKFIPFRRPAMGEWVAVEYRREKGSIFAYEVQVIPQGNR